MYPLILSLAVAISLGIGFSFGKAQASVEYLTIQNSDIRESRKEIERQIAEVAKAQKEYNDAQKKIADFAIRLRSTDRLRVQAEHRASIDAAEANSLRIYATGIHGLYSECREAYGELAVEGARAAASAQALD